MELCEILSQTYEIIKLWLSANAWQNCDNNEIFFICHTCKICDDDGFFIKDPMKSSVANIIFEYRIMIIKGNKIQYKELILMLSYGILNNSFD